MAEETTIIIVMVVLAVIIILVAAMYTMTTISKHQMRLQEIHRQHLEGMLKQQQAMQHYYPGYTPGSPPGAEMHGQAFVPQSGSNQFDRNSGIAFGRAIPTPLPAGGAAPSAETKRQESFTFPQLPASPAKATPMTPEELAAQAAKEEAAAVKIQAGFRGHFVREQIKKHNTAASKIQAQYKGFKSRQGTRKVIGHAEQQAEHSFQQSNPELSADGGVFEMEAGSVEDRKGKLQRTSSINSVSAAGQPVAKQRSASSEQTDQEVAELLLAKQLESSEALAAAGKMEQEHAALVIQRSFKGMKQFKANLARKRSFNEARSKASKFETEAKPPPVPDRKASDVDYMVVGDESTASELTKSVAQAEKEIIQAKADEGAAIVAKFAKNKAMLGRSGSIHGVMAAASPPKNAATTAIVKKFSNSSLIDVEAGPGTLETEQSEATGYLDVAKPRVASPPPRGSEPPAGKSPAAQLPAPAPANPVMDERNRQMQAVANGGLMEAIRMEEERKKSASKLVFEPAVKAAGNAGGFAAY